MRNTTAGVAAPRGAHDLDAAWLTAALAEVSGGATVTAVSARRIGNGMVADSVRLEVTWDRPTVAPDTYVAKVPAAEATSRAGAAASQTYLVEASFYRDLADTLEVHRPQCYLALHEPETNDYVVLLGDLSPATAGDQIAGCAVADALQVIPELAALHGPRWGDPALQELEWLRPSEDGGAGLVELSRVLFPGFMERYADRLVPGVGPLLERLMDRLGEYVSFRPDVPQTVVHGDFRLDNLLFGGERVAVLDWQTVKLGTAMSDVAYFIGSALQPDERRDHEEQLVRDYHERLQAYGVDLPWDRCWAGYRRHSYDGLLMATFASMMVGRTDRGDDMFMAMANRHGQQILDLDGESLLGGW